MNEHQLRRAILLIIRSLLHSNLAQIPDINPPVT
jgi:hypothetical protein